MKKKYVAHLAGVMENLRAMNVLLDAERLAVSNGDYDRLVQVADEKTRLMESFQIDGAIASEVRELLQEVLQKSTDNGMMVESALRFWRKAHQQLMHQYIGGEVDSSPFAAGGRQ
ncbi:hypothetical protein [Acidithiobacillus ferriphilus]|jgi:hypothetical protein|uniref:hypothetical protein n=1 Tax=Acidithiobacillus ferriphilus TaxID=1689834 RepID=UPI002DB6E293|nr:hypothetical protein [Acidithiobacillus ferriphilus]MEB8535863.1 hypothetical protein [Acidithiobacillus ferriphilus]